MIQDLSQPAANNKPVISPVRLSELVLDPTIQARVEIRDDIVRQYVDRLQAGDTFPPLAVFHVSAEFILVDGYHRYSAALKIALTTFPAEIHVGNRHDALIFGLGANAAHGLPLSAADKRHAVQIALAQLPDWSDRSVADIVKVSPAFVGKVRKQLFTVNSSRRIGADGKVRNLPAKTKSNRADSAGSGDALKFADAKTDLTTRLERFKSLLSKETSSLAPRAAMDVIQQLRGFLEELASRLESASPSENPPATQNDSHHSEMTDGSQPVRTSFTGIAMKILSACGKPISMNELCLAAEPLLSQTGTAGKTPMQSFKSKVYAAAKADPRHGELGSRRTSAKSVRLPRACRDFHPGPNSECEKW